MPWTWSFVRREIVLAAGASSGSRTPGIAGAETGSVGCPQRFGSSLNLYLHFHTLALDGDFEKTAEAVRFHHAPPPSKDATGEVARRVCDRAPRWLRRRGYLDDRAAEDGCKTSERPCQTEGRHAPDTILQNLP